MLTAPGGISSNCLHKRFYEFAKRNIFEERTDISITGIIYLFYNISWQIFGYLWKNSQEYDKSMNLEFSLIYVFIYNALIVHS